MSDVHSLAFLLANILPDIHSSVAMKMILEGIEWRSVYNKRIPNSLSLRFCFRSYLVFDFFVAFISTFWSVWNCPSTRGDGARRSLQRQMYPVFVLCSALWSRGMTNFPNSTLIWIPSWYWQVRVRMMRSTIQCCWSILKDSSVALERFPSIHSPLDLYVHGCCWLRLTG